MSILLYLLIPILFLSPILKNNKGFQITRYVIGFILTFLVVYIGNIDRGFSGFIVMLKYIAIAQVILSCLEKAVKDKHKLKADYMGTFVVAWILILVFSISYTVVPPIIKAKSLSNMAGIKESDKSSPEVNTENIIIISPQTAYYQMQTLIGSLPNPSLYKIGEISLTQTKKGAFYVAPIEIEGGFKSLINKELPGVAYVSAEKLEEAKLINVSFKYGDSLSFSHNIYRKLREYSSSAVLFNANVELDDDMNPYYIGSYGHYQYGRSGPVLDGVIMYNLKTDEFKTYKKDKAPEWVEQIYTAKIAESYNNYYGKFKDGWLNSKIGQKGVHIPTNWASGADIKGLEIESKQVVGVVGSNDRFYYFTDHTNTSDTSTTMTGYTLMDTRTGEMIYYKTPGFLNGQGAMNSVEKLLGANKSNWTTAQPVLYNIYGIQTWIIPVINKTDGSFVKIGLVTAQSKYSIVAENKSELLEQFKKAIANGKVEQGQDVKIQNNAKMEEKQVEGKILRINQYTEDGKSVFYLKLDTVQDKIFMINKNLNSDIVLARDGDMAKIKYIEMNGEKIQAITEFNLK